ncbi:MAG: aspartyl protease family protein, partial [Nitrospinae bacterium]|nr:aspartyl protease family protein [Nitrospinota bacterium]
MKQVALIFTFLFLLAPFGADAGDYVTWTDEAGVVHFGDSDADIPPQYRKKIEEREYTKTTPKSTVREATAGEGASAPVGPTGEWKPKVYTVKFRRWEETARRIILDVRFNAKVTAPMILDTGAPGTMISYALSERLGLSGDKSGALLSLAGGIGGTAPAIETILDTVEVGEMKDTFVPTTVAEFRRDGLYEGLLGMSFMSNYSMKID